MPRSLQSRPPPGWVYCSAGVSSTTSWILQFRAFKCRPLTKVFRIFDIRNCLTIFGQIWLILEFSIDDRFVYRIWFNEYHWVLNWYFDEKQNITSFIFDFVKLRKNNIFDLYNEQRNAYLYKILIYKYKKYI